MKKMEVKLQKEFGAHFLNLRDSLIHLDFKKENIVLSDEDRFSLYCEEVPPALLIDGLHFNNITNQLIAKMIYNRFLELGY